LSEKLSLDYYDALCVIDIIIINRGLTPVR
jgi:hypothetical protein